MVESVKPGAVPLELEDVTKSFAGATALDHASFDCRAGEVHALVGENGAGKSTLIKIAAGALVPDEGEVRIEGAALHPASVLKAREWGLLTAYQDTALVHGMSVEENILLSLRRGPAGVAAGVSEVRAEIAAVLHRFDLPFRPGDQVASMSPASRQLLEIARAVVLKPKVLLLDEPTATLDATGAQRLEDLVGEVRARGSAVVYISHRLDEVKRLADRLTVIRDGAIQGTFDRGEWEIESVVELMVGMPVDLAFPPKQGVASDAPVRLAARDFRGAGFGPAEFSVRRGEIVGIAGAEGNGQRELIRALVGLQRSRGSVEVDGVAGRIGSPGAALKRGIFFSSGDRATESVFAELGVMENATLGARRDLGPSGLILGKRQKGKFEPLAEQLKIAHASAYQPIGELSGGNQQKTVLARALLSDASVMVIDEPTAGVDASARLDIYRALRDEVGDGKAILVSSSDSAELEGLCDRVYVISRGKFIAQLVGDHVAESEIVESFVSAKAERREQPAASASGARFGGLRSLLGRSGWIPFAALLLLMAIVGAITQAHTSVFLSELNIASLLTLAAPLALLALGQQVVLIAGGFDISIGSAMSLSVVLASFWVTQPHLYESVPGILAVLGIGACVGLLNGLIVRVIGVSPIITTVAMLGILQGVAILLRPEPGGVIGSGLTEAVSSRVGFMPWIFAGTLVLALVMEAWLWLTPSGLTLRATGLGEEPSRRTGVQVQRIKIGAYVVCSVAALGGGLLLAGQVGLGQNSAGATYTLPAFTACFLGGAGLAGGRGSFVGALVGAVFLTMLVNVTPLLSLPSATSELITGVLTVVAVVAYSFRFGTGTSRTGKHHELDDPPAVPAMPAEVAP